MTIILCFAAGLLLGHWLWQRHLDHQFMKDWQATYGSIHIADYSAPSSAELEWDITAAETDSR